MHYLQEPKAAACLLCSDKNEEARATRARSIGDEVQEVTWWQITKAFETILRADSWFHCQSGGRKPLWAQSRGTGCALHFN